MVHLDSWADPHRRFDEDSLAFKIAMGIVAAAADDPELAEPAARWVDRARATSPRASQFLFTVTDVAVVLRRA